LKDLRGEVGNGSFVRVVVGIGVLSLCEALNEFEFLLSKSDVLLMELVLDSCPVNSAASMRKLGNKRTVKEKKLTIHRFHLRLLPRTCRARLQLPVS
jgi:hypothetical protein